MYQTLHRWVVVWPRSKVASINYDSTVVYDKVAPRAKRQTSERSERKKRSNHPRGNRISTTPGLPRQNRTCGHSRTYSILLDKWADASSGILEDPAIQAVDFLLVVCEWRSTTTFGLLCWVLLFISGRYSVRSIRGREMTLAPVFKSMGKFLFPCECQFCFPFLLFLYPLTALEPLQERPVV